MVGALLFGSLVCFTSNSHLTSFVWLIGIASGLFWAVGQFQQFQSMKAIGISVTVPVSTGMQLVCTTLAGVLLFHEWTTTKNVSFWEPRYDCFNYWIVFTSLRDRANVSREGFNAGAGAGVDLFLQLGTRYTRSLLTHPVWTQGSFPAAISWYGDWALLFAARNKPFGKPMVKNIGTGLVWGVGNFFMFMSIPAVGLAISYSLAQVGSSSQPLVVSCS